MKAFALMVLMVALAPSAGVAASSQCGSPGGMGDMAATMEQIRATEDPAERERMLEEHLEQMHSSMAQMQCMMGEMMGQMDAQRTETKRLHDHRRTKNR